MSHTTRRPYTQSKAIDKTCRSHGGCPYCAGGREYKAQRQMGADDEVMVLGEEDRQAFVDALLNPQGPNAALKAAHSRYMVLTDREAMDASLSDGDVYDGATVVVHRMGGA